MWSVGLILVLCMVLASLWTHWKSDAISDDRDDSARLQCGGASPTAPTIRGLRLSNKGKDVLLFSKIGLYLRLADATGNRIDWLEENKASVQFYTNGLVASKGDTIDMKTPTPDSYATVSREHYVAMPPETSLVIDLNADVPIAAVRVGAVESTTAPEQRRLLVETSAQYSSIADATFTAGFVRGQKPSASDPSSHISASGIYEYAATPTGFAPAFDTVIVAKNVGTQSIVVPTTLRGASVLIVGGGGGGAFSGGGGGGAGDIVYIADATINAGPYTVTVGAGGVGAASDGGDGTTGGSSVAFGLTADGGGGGTHKRNGLGGGSGGGAGYEGGTGGEVSSRVRSGTSAIGPWVRFGNVGGSNPRNNAGLNYGCAGGGGAGKVGGNCTSTYGGGGGDGLPDWSRMGVAAGVGHNVNGVVWFGGGGGGSSDNNASGKGGKGGGGDGSSGILANPNIGEPKAKNGLANTGGGGGGGRMSPPSHSPPAGSGGSGVIIILGKSGALDTSITASAAITPAPVTSGLVILIDPDQPASFPGSGASLTNLVSGGGVATLSGTYEPVTILGKKAIHLINTSTSIASNQATLFLPTARVHTISIWYFVTFVCVAPTKYVLDGRTTTPDTYIMNGQYGAVWSSSHYYLNGGAARTISSSVLECFGAVSTSWQHITLVATGVQPSATFNLFRRYNAQEGMDINVGRVTVYDRALSQSENAAMYHAGWSSAGVPPASPPPPAITPAPSTGGHEVFWPAGREGNSLSTFCNAMWDETVAPLGFTTHPVALKTYPSLQQIATYWIKFVDLSMYVWSDGTPIDVGSFPTKFGAVGPFFHPSYYKATFPYHAYQIMTPLSWRARYFFDPNLDYKWGYSVPTSATRIALCLDNDLQGNGDQTPNAPTPQYDWHRTNRTTWTLWGYPNKNYNDADRVLLGTFSTSNCTRSRGMYKWSAIPSWPSGRRFTHYLWQPSTYKGPGTWWSCPPLLCE